MLFIIYQNQSIKNHRTQFKALGREKACEEIAGVEAYYQLSLEEAEWSPELFKHFTPVAAVHTSNFVGSTKVPLSTQLEIVFKSANIGDKKATFVNFGQASSLSVGDLVMTDDDEPEFYLVSGFGFKQVVV